MGALTGNLSYLRFAVDGEPPRSMAAKYERNIEARRFMPLDPGDADESELERTGWAPLLDPYDDELAITREEFIFGDLIAVAYREDKMSIPRPLVRSQTARRYAEHVDELEKRGEKPGRQARRNVELAVVAELRARTLPRPRVVDMVWDLSYGELRVFGRGSIATERAIGLFERTFDVRARLAHYGARAFRQDLSLRAQAVLEGLGPELVFEA